MDGLVEGKLVAPDALEQKLSMHTCHSDSALESYKEKCSVIDTTDGEEAVWDEMERIVRSKDRSKGPQPPPRVALLGPRGVGLPEIACRLAARLGAVFVDGAQLELLVGRHHASPNFCETPMNSPPQSAPHADEQRVPSLTKAEKSKTFMMLDNLEPLIAHDRLGSVGVRLRQHDCEKQGWVMCGFPDTIELADKLREDHNLMPTRVIALGASADTCVQNLENVCTDKLTGQVYTTLPNIPKKRLRFDPENRPEAVRNSHEEYTQSLPVILEALGAASGKCLEISAEASPEAVFHELVEFVERPLALPPRS